MMEIYCIDWAIFMRASALSKWLYPFQHPFFCRCIEYCDNSCLWSLLSIKVWWWRPWHWCTVFYCLGITILWILYMRSQYTIHITAMKLHAWQYIECTDIVNKSIWFQEMHGWRVSLYFHYHSLTMLHSMNCYWYFIKKSAVEDIFCSLYCTFLTCSFQI